MQNARLHEIYVTDVGELPEMHAKPLINEDLAVVELPELHAKPLIKEDWQFII